MHNVFFPLFDGAVSEEEKSISAGRFFGTPGIVFIYLNSGVSVSSKFLLRSRDIMKTKRFIFVQNWNAEKVSSYYIVQSFIIV